jgi:hypothetical protein
MALPPLATGRSLARSLLAKKVRKECPRRFCGLKLVQDNWAATEVLTQARIELAELASIMDVSWHIRAKLFAPERSCFHDARASPPRDRALACPGTVPEAG